MSSKAKIGYIAIVRFEFSRLKFQHFIGINFQELDLKCYACVSAVNTSGNSDNHPNMMQNTPSKRGKICAF